MDVLDDMKEIRDRELANELTDWEIVDIMEVAAEEIEWLRSELKTVRQELAYAQAERNL